MSNEPETEQAWAWYDTTTLEIRHVGFTDKGQDDRLLRKIPMEFNTAVDILEGRSKLIEYYIGDDELGRPSIIYKKRAPAFKKFWQLIDPETAAFNGKFIPSESQTSPIVIRQRNADGFVVDVIGRAKNIVFYITMKNDPNYLIKRIELYPHAVTAGSTDSIPVTVGLTDDYSIYVRYDAA